MRHIHQATVVIFCRLAPSLLHHSANAGHCNRTAETRCSIAACGCTGCHSGHRARLGARKKVHYVEDSMRVRAHLVTSARRHLPCLAFACTRMRGNTIVSQELTQIGVKKGLKIRFVLIGRFQNGEECCTRRGTSKSRELKGQRPTVQMFPLVVAGAGGAGAAGWFMMQWQEMQGKLVYPSLSPLSLSLSHTLVPPRVVGGRTPRF